MDGFQTFKPHRIFARLAVLWREARPPCSRLPMHPRKLARDAGPMAFAVAAGLFACTAFAAAERPDTLHLDLDTDGIGVAPKDFDFSVAGGGAPGRWSVVREDAARSDPAIEQFSAEKSEQRFALAIYKPRSWNNFVLRVRIKAVDGRLDQLGGIVLRLKSPGDFYAVGANALRDEVVFYRAIGGTVERVEGVETAISRKQWHTFDVAADGNRFSVSLDETWLFAVQDETFGEEGRIGLITKADSIMQFARIEITPLPWSK